MHEYKLPTMKELARQLNISTASVSRALNGHPSIGLGTRMRVEKLAKELNYIPNPNAILFKQGKTSTIGLLMPNFREEFFAEAASAIENIAYNHKYHTIFGQSHDDADREQRIIASLQNQRVDGIIVSLAKNTKNYDHFMALKRSHIPVVFFDRVPDRKDVHKVCFDMYKGTREALSFLFDKGHRRIAILNGPDAMISSKERTEAYKEIMIKRRIKIDLSLVTSTDMTQAGTFRAMDELMHARPVPTAVLVMNDYVALDVMQYARKNNLIINKDLCIISYANLPMTHYLEQPPMASIEQYPHQLASTAANLLFELLHSPDKGYASIQPRHLMIEGKLVHHCNFA